MFYNPSDDFNLKGMPTTLFFKCHNVSLLSVLESVDGLDERFLSKGLIISITQIIICLFGGTCNTWSSFGRFPVSLTELQNRKQVPFVLVIVILPSTFCVEFVSISPFMLVSCETKLHFAKKRSRKHLSQPYILPSAPPNYKFGR